MTTAVATGDLTQKIEIQVEGEDVEAEGDCEFDGGSVELRLRAR
jgi:hypothetical protein